MTHILHGELCNIHREPLRTCANRECESANLSGETRTTSTLASKTRHLYHGDRSFRLHIGDRRVSPHFHAQFPRGSHLAMHRRKCTSRRAQPQPPRFERAAVDMAPAGRSGWCRRSRVAPPPSDGRARSPHRLDLGGLARTLVLSRDLAARGPRRLPISRKDKCCFGR